MTQIQDFHIDNILRDCAETVNRDADVLQASYYPPASGMPLSPWYYADKLAANIAHINIKNPRLGRISRPFTSINLHIPNNFNG